MTSHLERQIAADASYLASSWPLLVMLGRPGAGERLRRPTRPPSAAALERAAEQAREDRAEARKPGYAAPGKHAVPIAVTLLDLLAEFVEVAADVCETVGQLAGVEQLPQPASCWTDPRPYLERARAWLQPAHEADDATEPWVARQLHALADKVAVYLGEVHDGQVLLAICPWCLGRTEQHPEGGELTLTVYARLSRDEQAAASAPPSKRPGEHIAAPAPAPRPGERAADRETLIVCRGLNCQPPDGDVGKWVGPKEGPHRPGWPPREWDWLAKRLLLPKEATQA